MGSILSDESVRTLVVGDRCEIRNDIFAESDFGEVDLIVEEGSCGSGLELLGVSRDSLGKVLLHARRLGLRARIGVR